MTGPAYMALARARGEEIPEPVVPTPADLRAWRDAEDLTQDDAARLAGVARETWARWEIGTRAIPQWLADTLRQRWGTAP